MHAAGSKWTASRQNAVRIAASTGLCIETARKIADGQRVHRTCAEIFASTYGVSIGSVFGSSQMTHIGRPTPLAVG